ncbi:hypothetical protein PLICRDRAFT_179500 [Plicaturopsis crispa FD-325 SS-3]|uniref:Retrotransposon Copia-like N-terminal domain-containing protein n=1 Tax=Plicaturopsis crispa FD-325 SS-3 TaxID=944288 RepID=A0A0C9SRI7_PLICR|nr:hypothetical protein PLICRDRAFT_179500 [Plicaturopsis crispa FD-325 SS-3]
MSIQTGSSSLLAAIPALSDGNWFVWKKGMRMFLLANSAGGVLDGVAPKDGLDGTLLPFIWSKIAPEWQFLVEDAVGAVAAWKALQAHFEKSTMSNRLSARQALYSVVHDPQQPISLYIQSLTAARAKLDALGVKIDDQEFKDVLLMRLDDSFSSLRTTILAQSPEPDLARISSLLTSSALSGSSASVVKGEESETALYSHSSRSRVKGESVRSFSAPVDAKGAIPLLTESVIAAATLAIALRAACSICLPTSRIGSCLLRRLRIRALPLALVALALLQIGLPRVDHLPTALVALRSLPVSHPRLVVVPHPPHSLHSTSHIPPRQQATRTRLV